MKNSQENKQIAALGAYLPHLSMLLCVSIITLLLAESLRVAVGHEVHGLDGTIYGIRLSRDIVKGKLSGQAELRLVDYQYANTEFALTQTIVGLNLSWRIHKKFSLNMYYEGLFGSTQDHTNMHLRAIRRF